MMPQQKHAYWWRQLTMGAQRGVQGQIVYLSADMLAADRRRERCRARREAIPVIAQGPYFIRPRPRTSDCGACAPHRRPPSTAQQPR